MVIFTFIELKIKKYLFYLDTIIDIFKFLFLIKFKKTNIFYNYFRKLFLLFYNHKFE